MPNRIIKESIWTSPNLSQADDMAELLFYRLLPLPDDHGCFEATPEIIAGRCFPHKKKWTADVVRQHLPSLVVNGLIQLWFENNRLFGYFPAWSVHQRIRSLHNRKTPEPKEELLNNQEVMEYLNLPADSCRQLTTSDGPNHNNLNLNPNPGTPPTPPKSTPKEKKPRKKKQPTPILTDDQCDQIIEHYVEKSESSRTFDRQTRRTRLRSFGKVYRDRGYPPENIVEDCKNLITAIRENWTTFDDGTPIPKDFKTIFQYSTQRGTGADQFQKRMEALDEWRTGEKRNGKVNQPEDQFTCGACGQTKKGRPWMNLGGPKDIRCRPCAEGEK
jgi:hypothetical protein